GVGSSSHWTRNIEALARHYRVVAFDLPGYGASPDVPENLEPEHYIDWVAAAVDEAAGDGCELAGFSFGGAIAARIAARLGARIRHLSLLAPGGFGAPKGRVIPTVKVPSLGAPSRERRQAVAANLAGWMLSALPGVDDEVVDMQRTAGRRLRARAIRGAATFAARSPPGETAQSLRRPLSRLAPQQWTLHRGAVYST
ncbi:MAG: alpha/beta fold hydrolase, partial [Rhizobiales bacterium]|nr:alpha/beta fold hydrolase [Hyphomicrobiales bacterium]